MLKLMEKNKKYILGLVTIGLFGITGLLLAPVIVYIIKVSNRYPQAFRWFFFALFVFVGIYGFLVERKWDMSLIMLCIAAAIAISSIPHSDRR